MQSSDIPSKLLIPFAEDGGRNAIPTESQIGITGGKASLTDGFPPVTRIPTTAGGIPPFGLDMNGILYAISAICRWQTAGAGFPYDADFATDPLVGGYPAGARVMRDDAQGYWLNTADDNETDPSDSGAAAAGWVPDFSHGVASVTMTSSHVTLTPTQYGLPIIEITGTITTDLNLIFPNISGSWTVINKTSGLFSITAKTASGLGIVAPKNLATVACCNSTDIFAINRPDVTPYDFGAKGDYFFSDGTTVNPSPTADQAAIMAAYAYCVKYSKPLKMTGDFYTTGSVNLSFRPSGGSGRMIIDAAAAIYANLDSGATNAVYVGDDTTNGIYPLIIAGQLSIQNAGAIQTGKIGFHAQDAAYGYWCVSASGFDCGIYIQGCIYSTIDGGQRACSNNFQDMRIESYRSTNPVPILRFTNNILEVKNIKLASKAKLAIVVGASVASPFQQNGGLMRFDRVLFEGTAGSAASVPYTVYIERTAEAVESKLAEIVFSHCWFEIYLTTQPMMAIDLARVTLLHCFIAHSTTGGAKQFQLNSDDSYLVFDNTNAYFGDGAPSYVVERSGTATDAYRSNITVKSSNFYGPAGTLVPLHDGYPAGFRYFCYSTSDGSRFVKMRFDAIAPKFPTNTTDDYMQNATLNVVDFVTALFGTKVSSADIYIGATDGSASMSAHVLVLPYKSVLTYTSDANLTLSGNVLTFPTSLIAAFYRPSVHVTARIAEQEYALA